MKSIKESIIGKRGSKPYSFSKDDLRLNDIAVTRDGTIMILNSFGQFEYKNGCAGLNFFSNDLYFLPATIGPPRKDRDRDIMMIYRCRLNSLYEPDIEKQLKKEKPIWRRS